MPAWASLAPGAVPGRLSGLGSFPQSKIHGMMLAGVHLNAGTCLHIFQLATAELAIAGELLHAVEYIAIVQGIGEAGIHQLLHHGHDICHCLADPGINICMAHIQCVHGLEVGLDIPVGNILPGHAFLVSSVDDFVIHIGEILDIFHLQAMTSEEASNHIPGHKRTGVADMRVIIWGHATAINADFPFLQGLEFFFLSAECIIDFKHNFLQ